jgi:hypothetical protein
MDSKITSSIVKKKPPLEETAFTALVWIGKPGGMLMQGVSVRSLSFPAKGGGICPEEASKITWETVPRSVPPGDQGEP